MHNHDLARDCAEQWEPGAGVPRWLAITLAVAGTVVAAVLASAAVFGYQLVAQAW